MLCLGPKKIMMSPRLEFPAQMMIRAECDTTQLFKRPKVNLEVKLLDLRFNN